MVPAVVAPGSASSPSSSSFIASASASASAAAAASSSSARTPQHHRYAVDVLTDGSEGSYAGWIGGAAGGDGATIFLSVHKKPKNRSVVNPTTSQAKELQQEQEQDAAGDEEDGGESRVVARYAVAGVGDLTSRLASDQRLKLGCVRAVFVSGSRPSITGSDSSLVSTTADLLPRLPATTAPLWGLPSLHMALQKAGAETLTVVTPGGDTPSASSALGRGDNSQGGCYVEQVMQLLHSRSAHPSVRTCRVPAPTNAGAGASGESSSDGWWTVYRDEFVDVHAAPKFVPSLGDDHTNGAVVVCYLYTLRRLLVPTSGRGSSVIKDVPHETEPEMPSLLVVPPGFFGDHTRPLNGVSLLESILDPSTLPVPPQSIRLGVAVEPRSLATFQQEIAALSLRFPWVHTNSSKSGGAGSGGSDSSWRVAEHDPFLLVRAARQAQLRHAHDPAHFPWSHTGAMSSLAAVAGTPSHNSKNRTSQEVGDRQVGGESRMSEPGNNDDAVGSAQPSQSQQLRTGHSLTLSPVENEGEPNENKIEMKVIDRTRPLLVSETPKDSVVGSDQDVGHVENSIQEDYSLLDDTATCSVPYTDDDNQIDLDDCLEDGDGDNNNDVDIDCGVVRNDPPSHSFEEPFKVELLCLGTGCAAPSPYRGASGYAVFVNPSTSVVLDAGEGFVTQWNRHAQHRRSLSTIRIICISHAHWDHFGGLVPLLAAIHHAQRHQGSVIAREAGPDSLASRKRPRLTISGTDGRREAISRSPLLLAPDRVLQYVALSLADANGTYYTPVSLQRRDFAAALAPHLSALSREACGLVGDPTDPLEGQPPRQLAPPSACPPSLPTLLTLDKVRVDHCPHSYGFVLAIDRTSMVFGPRVVAGTNPMEPPFRPFLLCYSGDTRPCDNLVRACHFYSAMYGRQGIDFLLHEATFMDDDAKQCEAKRHSTVKDAVEISRRVGAGRTLLTHFSQRYSGASARRAVGSDLGALDGARDASREGHDRPCDGHNAPTPSRVMEAVDGLQIRLC